jgi:hypothetical protein
MKQSSSLFYFAILAFAALSSGAVQAQDLPVSRTAAVLDITLPINQSTLVSIPLVSIVASGTITSVSGTTLGVSATLGALSTPHAIKITSRDDQRGTGANAPAGSSTTAYGQSSRLASNTANTVVTNAALTPNVGDEFIIYELETLASLFGAPPAAGWNTTTGSAGSDLVYLDNAGVVVAYFYKTGGLGGTGWRLASAPTGAEQGGTVIQSGHAVLVQRRNAGSAFNLRSTGVTTVGRESPAVVAGFNIVNNPFSVSTTLAASGLNAHVTGSTGAASADTIYIESAGVLNSYFYKTGGLGGVGWRLTSAPTGADQGGVVLTPGKAILFREQAGSVGFALPEPFAE